VLELTYLRKRFRPDCDWIEGRLEARHGGLRNHSLTMSRVAIWFGVRQKQFGIVPLISPRILVAERRYRVADVCVLKLPDTNGDIITSPPWIVVEVLSPKDRMARVIQRTQDYLRMGVPNAWVVDPESRRGWSASLKGLRRVAVLQTVDGAAVLPVDAVWEDDEISPSAVPCKSAGPH
jgi:Uma2 family endonuclease